MPFLTRLFSSFKDCENATAHLLKILKVEHTRSFLQKELLEHPDYPSLITVADVIGASYNISSLGLSMDRRRILSEPEITPPFVASIKSRTGSSTFAVITALNKDEIEWYNADTKKQETITPETFDNVFLGTLLMAKIAPGDVAGEKEYIKNQKVEKQKNFFNAAAILLTPIVTLLACILFLIIAGATTVTFFTLLFMLFTLAGCLVGTALLWYEIDAHNPVAQQVCQGNKKVNCAAILNSKASKIFGLSWSSIGFVYFFGMLLWLVATGLSNPALMAWINVLALPYVFFSIYYQWKVARQWCMLCLTIQGLLVLQFGAALAGGFLQPSLFTSISPLEIIGALGAFAFVFTVILVTLPALQKAKESRQKTIQLQRQKQNPQIFEALLAKQKAIEKPPADLGITIGTPDSIFKLIKVCNPYCGPCASAHPVMETLIENNEALSLQIIFTAADDDKDFKKPPVAHLLAIDTKGDKALTQHALDDWYNAPIKDYAAFAAKYSLNGELSLQNEKIKAMHEWCNKTGIAFTPTFFICLNTADENATFYQLPDMYSLNDLKYFLAV